MRDGGPDDYSRVHRTADFVRDGDGGFAASEAFEIAGELAASVRTGMMKAFEEGNVFPCRRA